MPARQEGWRGDDERSQTEPHSESRYVLPAHRVLTSGDAGALMQRDRAFLHERDVHVRRKRVSEAVANSGHEVGVELRRRKARAGGTRAEARVPGGTDRDLDDLMKADDTAAAGVQRRR